MLTSAMKPHLIRWQISEKWQKALPKIAYSLALIAAIIGFLGLDILGLAKTAMVAMTTSSVSNPLFEISSQEPLSVYWYRPLLMLISGILVAFAVSKPGDKTEFAPKEKMLPKLVIPVVLLILTIVATFIRESAPEALLLMNGNWRFLIAILLAVGSGFLFGAVTEMTLIRPLYVRSFFIVLLTLGLSYVIRELVQLLWDPLAYQMSRPPLFAQSGKASSILDWLQNGYSTIDISGVTFPTYRLFVIFLGIVMFIFLLVLMTKTRLGMIIRAGVQDPQMVEALGINVKKVFTIVFAMGVAMAALGGIGAGPFLPIQPQMGDQYLMQGFITVVIGGMGSYVGAFVGALILGMARAFGDYFALKLSLSPALAEASTVIIMIIVLLVRPQGLFGKKE
jgi:branched-chain amino acid transport system permease protein